MLVLRAEPSCMNRASLRELCVARERGPRRSVGSRVPLSSLATDAWPYALVVGVVGEAGACSARVASLHLQRHRAPRRVRPAMSPSASDVAPLEASRMRVCASLPSALLRLVRALASSAVMVAMFANSASVLHLRCFVLRHESETSLVAGGRILMRDLRNSDIFGSPTV